MKMSHQVDYFSKFPNEKFGIEYDFSNDLDTGEQLSSCTATITDSASNDLTSSMISAKSVTATECNFTISKGIADTNYQIKLAGVSDSANVFVHYITCEVFGTITINTKIGDSDTNSYVTLAEANDYLRNKRGHGNIWDTLTEEGKKRILIEAAEEIDAFNYNGEPYYPMQRLSFPRDDHEIVTGDCATPYTNTSFRNSDLYTTTYGDMADDYWKYGTVHITAGTASNDVRNISQSSNTNGSITVETAFSATVAASSDFIVFAPMYKEVKNAQCEQALYIVENSNIETLQNYKALNVEEIRLGDARVRFRRGGMSKMSISSLAKKLLSRWIRHSVRVGRA